MNRHHSRRKTLYSLADIIQIERHHKGRKAQYSWSGIIQIWIHHTVELTGRFRSSEVRDSVQLPKRQVSKRSQVKVGWWEIQRQSGERFCVAHGSRRVKGQKVKPGNQGSMEMGKWKVMHGKDRCKKQKGVESGKVDAKAGECENKR